MTRLHVSEYLDLDIDNERWRCRVCEHDIAPGRDNYKTGLLVHDHDASEVHRPIISADITFSPHPDWIRLLEFYCPSCGTQVETEYLPIGHPITHDTEIDIDALRERLADGSIKIVDGHIEVQS